MTGIAALTGAGRRARAIIDLVTASSTGGEEKQLFGTTPARSISIILTSIAVALTVILTRPTELHAAGPIAGGGAVRNGRPVAVASGPGSSFGTAIMRVATAAPSEAGSGSSTSPPAASPPPDRSRRVVQLAEQDLATRLGVPPGQIDLLGVSSTSWADSSLGVPRPGLAYSQTVTPGYQITLQASGQAYVYHSDTGRLVVYCGMPSRGVYDLR
ncbi:MAG: hypothetical protein ACRDIY_22235 [Chloroflexota bacterium]